MRTVDLARLLLLASIWGASFLFMRILAPVLGPLWLAELRGGIAGIAMLLFMLATRRALHFKKNGVHYLVIGTIGSALPFALYSFAALNIPAGYSAIVNATSPLWGALVGMLMLGETLTPRKVTGLVVGVVGVAFLVRLGPVELNFPVVVAVLACATATLCYALTGVYAMKKTAGIPSPLMATGSQLSAALVLLPFVPLAPVRGEVTGFIVVIACALALLCSAIAYVLYFRLLADVGPTKALTVTFLIPLFALVWARLFLHEPITMTMLIGCALVALAMWLVVSKPKCE